MAIGASLLVLIGAVSYFVFVGEIKRDPHRFENFIRSKIPIGSDQKEAEKELGIIGFHRLQLSDFNPSMHFSDSVKQALNDGSLEYYSIEVITGWFSGNTYILNMIFKDGRVNDILFTTSHSPL